MIGIMVKRVTSRRNPTSKTETDDYVINNNNNNKIPHSMRMARPTDRLCRNESSGGDVWATQRPHTKTLTTSVNEPASAPLTRHTHTSSNISHTDSLLLFNIITILLFSCSTALVRRLTGILLSLRKHFGR